MPSPHYANPLPEPETNPMQLNTLYSLLLLLFVTSTGFAQAPVKLYRTKAGHTFTAAQKDSIKALGYQVILTKKTKVRDTTFVAMDVRVRENYFTNRLINKPLPAFSLKTLDGQVIDSESLKGKVVMINLWSTTCYPCLAEMPDLNQLKATYKDVVYLAPAPESAATINKLLSKHTFDFVIIPDAGQLFKDWKVTGYPRNLFVDKNGIVRGVKEGVPLTRNEKGERVVAAFQHYSPILKRLSKRKK